MPIFDERQQPSWDLDKIEQFKKESLAFLSDESHKHEGAEWRHAMSLLRESRTLADEVNRLLLKREQIGELMEVMRLHAFHEVDRVRASAPRVSSEWERNGDRRTSEHLAQSSA